MSKKNATKKHETAKGNCIANVGILVKKYQCMKEKLREGSEMIYGSKI